MRHLPASGRWPLLIVSAALCVQAHAQDELDALMDILDQETELATKTRMNSDFVPGLVTVLEGEKLQALGARTVWDALPYVPGVQATLNALGTPAVTVRGITFPFNTGGIRILVNATPIVRDSAGITGSALTIPIEQVERIEFIRGPGSVVYGDYAFQGLLNIITRRTGQQASATVDDEGGVNTSLLLSNDGDGPWKLSANLAAYTTDDARVSEGIDADEQRISGFFTAERGGFLLKGSVIDRDVDRDNPRPGQVGFDETTWSLDARYERDLTDTLTGTVRARYLSNDIAADRNAFDGSEAELALDLLWRGWDGHTWLAGVAYTDSDIDHSFFASPPPPPGVAPAPSVTYSGDDRRVFSAFLQDQIALSEALELTVGARYDDNSAVGSRVTPRLALVWRVTDNHILKAQYAQGFRGPTFFERVTEDGQFRNLDYEVNTTTELSYIYRRPALTFRATVFDSHIEDMVFVDFEQRSFDNVAEAKAQGIELELNQQLTPTLQLDANLSWVDSEDDRSPSGELQSLGAVPQWMANLGVLWHPAQDTTVGLHWNHIDARDSASPDSGVSDQVGVTVTRRNLFADGLDLQLGLTNLLGDESVHIVDGPVDDRAFRYDTRAVWARVSWSW